MKSFRTALASALIAVFAGGVSAPSIANDEGASLTTDPAATASLTGSQSERVSFYVRHRRGRGPEAASAIRAQGGEITHELSDWDTQAVMLPAPAAAALAANPAVALVERVPEYELHGQAVPWNIDQVQARDIWDKNRDGEVDVGAPNGAGVKLCIIDTGMYYDTDGDGPDTGHDDFRGITAHGMSQITGELWHFDGNGHGTHVAGTANAINDDIGVVGVMPGGAELYIVKIFNNSGVWVIGQSNLGAAAQACRNAGANVISMSLGGGFSATEKAIFQDLYDNNNILNIAAAGNAGNEVASYPGSYPAVISVAAIDEAQRAAYFTQSPPSEYGVPSNTAPRPNTEWDVVELAGGGVQVLSTVPGPNASVPIYQAVANGVTYSGRRIEGTAGEVTQKLVSGGLCDTTDAAWNGRVVLCQRGSVSFSAKVNNVRNSGGLATLIYNNVAGGFSGTCLDLSGNNLCTQPTIPSVSLSQAHGQTLLANAIGTSTRVTVDDGSACTTCNGGYDYMSGTSMATPGIAAAVGFIWNACGGPANVTNKQIRQLLRDSARDLQGTQTGSNRAYGAGWDPVTGWGLVQLKDALDLGNQRFGANCPVLLEVNPGQQNICTAASTAAAVDLTLDDRFAGSTHLLSVTGQPPSAGVSFSANGLLQTVQNSTLTLSGLSGVSGVFNLSLTAVDAANSATTAQGHSILNAFASAPSAPAPAQPVNGATGESSRPTLSWAAAADSESYTVEVSTSPSFATIAALSSTQATSLTVPNTLALNTVYYWRVRANNPCGGGSWSATRSFTTENFVCQTIPSADVPKALADATGGGPNLTAGVTHSTLSADQPGTITDINVLGLTGTHTYTNDLTFDLVGPSGTTVRIMNQSCAGGSNFGWSLDDQAAAGWQCPPTGGGVYHPSNPLSAFNGLAAQGTWTLRVRDVARQNSGQLTGWGLQICRVPPPNSAPVANDDLDDVAKGGTAKSLTGGATTVVANDADSEDGQPGGLVSLVAGPANGSLTLYAGGTFSYTHDGSETTTDSFSYKVQDSGGLSSNIATVMIRITNLNDAPVGLPMPDFVAAADAAVIYEASRWFSDPDSDPLSYSAQGLPSGLNIDATTGRISGTVALSDAGTYTASVSASDGAATATSSTLVVKVVGGTIFVDGFAD